MSFAENYRSVAGFVVSAVALSRCSDWVGSRNCINARRINPNLRKVGRGSCARSQCSCARWSTTFFSCAGLLASLSLLGVPACSYLWGVPMGQRGGRDLNAACLASSQVEFYAARDHIQSDFLPAPC